MLSRLLRDSGSETSSGPVTVAEAVTASPAAIYAAVAACMGLYTCMAVGMATARVAVHRRTRRHPPGPCALS